NTGDLPGNLHSRLASSDDEVVRGKLFRDVERSKSTDGRGVVAEVFVDRGEPGRKSDLGGTICIDDRVAGIEVQHLGRLDGRVIEVPVGRIQRVIDFKVLDGTIDRAGSG